MIFYRQNTFLRFSIDRSPFQSLLQTVDLFMVFHGQKIFLRPSIDRKPFQSLQQTGDLSKVFHRQKTFPRFSIDRGPSPVLLLTNHLFQVFCRQKTFLKNYLRNVLYREKIFLSIEDLKNVFCLQKTSEWSSVYGIPLKGLLQKILQRSSVCRRFLNAILYIEDF